MALLDDRQVDERLRGLPEWTREGDAIKRSFELADFVGSVDFVNRLTPVAEEMNHHPDLSISWNRVAVSLSTHSQGGLTDSDFALAEQLDRLAG
jgi:4a-hydroxytetrahydrobiopterin dehydratase